MRFGLKELQENPNGTPTGWDLEFDPVMEVDLKKEWKTFEEYSAALRKKSRTKIRRIIRGSEELILRDLTLEEITELADSLHDLYKQVYDRAGFTLGQLHKEDLITLKKHWGDDFPVIAYYLEEELVGFQCGIATPHTTEAFFVGFKQEENKLHFYTKGCPRIHQARHREGSI